MKIEQLGQYLQEDPTRAFYLVGIGIVIALIIILLKNKLKNIFKRIFN